jgi:S1-C subfamily serine protease
MKPLWVVSIMGVMLGLTATLLSLNPALRTTSNVQAASLSLLSSSYIYKRAKPAVMTVRTNLARLDDLEARGVGTAFHIGGGYFVTSAHVIAASSKVMLEDSNRTLEKPSAAAKVAQVIGSDTLTEDKRPSQ